MHNCLQKKSAKLLKKNAPRKLLASFFVFMMILTGAQAAAYYWVGGTSGNWSDPTNWSTDNTSFTPQVAGDPVPGSDASDIVNLISTATITVNSDITIAQLLIPNPNNQTDDFTVTITGNYLLTVSTGIETFRPTSDPPDGNKKSNLIFDCNVTSPSMIMHSGGNITIESGKTANITNIANQGGGNPETLLTVNGNLQSTSISLLTGDPSVTTRKIEVGSTGKISTGSLTGSSGSVSNAGLIVTQDSPAAGLITSSGSGTSTVAAAGAFVWTGDSDDDWTNDSNWLGGSAPGTSDTSAVINIPKVSTLPIIPTGTSLSFAADNLNIDTDANVTVNGELTLTGDSASFNLSKINTNSTGSLNISGNLSNSTDYSASGLALSCGTFTSTNNLTCKTLSISGAATFNSDSNLTLETRGSSVLSFGDTFTQNGTGELTINSSGNVTFSAATQVNSLAISASGKDVSFSDTITSSASLSVTADNLSFASTATVKDITISATTSTGSNMTVTGNWTNNGAFTASAGTVTFTTGNSDETPANLEGNGSNNFSNLEIQRNIKIKNDVTLTGNFTANKKESDNHMGGRNIMFANGKKLTVAGNIDLKGRANSGAARLRLCGINIASDTWELECNGTASIQYVNFKGCSANPTLQTINCTDSGGNSGFLFPGQLYKWVGGESGHETEWNRPANWNPATVPSAGAAVEIQAVALASSPVLTADLDIKATLSGTDYGTILIDEGATFDLAGYSLTATSITNNGKVRISGAESITASMSNGTSSQSVVEYYDTSTTLSSFIWNGGNATSPSYKNLILLKPVSSTQVISVSGTVKIGNIDEATPANNVNAGSVTLKSNDSISLEDNVLADVLDFNCETKIKNIKVTDSVTFEKPVTLLSNSTITSAAGDKIHFKDTLTGSSYNLTTNTGNSQFDNTISGINTLTTDTSVTFTGNVTAGTISTKAATINCASIESTLNGQTFDGALSILNDVTFTAPADELIYFKNTVTGSGSENLATNTGNSQFDDTISGINNLTTDANVTFAGNVTAGTLSTKAATINCTSIETTSDGQTFNGAVSIQNSLTFSAPADKLIYFKNTVTGNGSADLTINTGISQFDASISDINNLTTNTNVTFAGNINTGTISTQAASINCSQITTTGNQTYNDTISLGNDLTLETGSSSAISIAKNISAGGKTLTVNSPTFKSTATSANSITADKIVFSSSATSIQSPTAELTFAVPLIDGSGEIKLETSGSKISFTGDVSINPKVTTASGTNLIASSDSMTFNNDVNLANNTLSANNGTIILTSGSLSGNNTFKNLTLKGHVTLSGSNTITDLNIHDSVTISANNTITNITANTTTDGTSGLGGKTITFGAGSEQTVSGKLTLKGTSNTDNNRLLLRSTIPTTTSSTGTPWKIVCSGTNEHIIEFVDIQDSNNTTSSYFLFALNSIDHGNNTKWNFPGMKYKWTGADSTDPTNWNVAANWEYLSIPGKGADVTIPEITTSPIHYPKLITDLDLNDSYGSPAVSYTGKITIAANAQFDLAGKNLTTGTITNNGKVRLTGADSQSITAKMLNGTDSTVEYYDTGAATTNFAWDGDNGTAETGKQYANLILNQATTGNTQLTVSEELIINEAADLTGQLTVAETTTISAASNKSVSLNNASNIFTGNVILGSTTTATGNITLKAASLITLADNANAASLTLESPVLPGNKITTSGDQTYNSQVQINTASVLTAPDTRQITFNGEVTGSAKLTTEGAAVAHFNGNVNGLNELETQAAVINCTSLSTAGNQTYNDNVSITTSGTNGASLSSDNSIIFNGPVTGTAKLKISGDGISYFNNTVQIGSLETQATNINCTSIETTNEGQIYNGEVTLERGVVLTAPSTKIINFKNSIHGNNGSETLQINIADSQFDDTISNLASLTTAGNTVFTKNVTVGELSTQAASINCSQITTTGNQTYNDTISLGNDLTLETGSSSAISIAENISADGKTLTVNSPTFKSTATSANTITADKIVFSSSATSIQSPTAELTFAVPLIDGSGEIKLETSGSKISFTGDVSINPKVTTASGTNLIASSDSMTFNNDVNLANNTLSANNGTIILTSGSLSGNNTFKNLTLKGHVTLSGSNTITDLNIHDSVTISADNTITNVTANTSADGTPGLGGKTITFGAGSEQTVSGLLTLKGSSEENKLTLRSSSTNSQWKIKCTGSNTHTIQYIDVKDSLNESETGSPTAQNYNLFALNSWDSGNNTNWNFPGMRYLWKTNATSSDWNTASNWVQNSIPGKGALVTIQAPVDNSAKQPILTSDLDLKDTFKGDEYSGEILVSSSAVFDLAGKNLTVGTITNNSRVRLTGADGQTITAKMVNGTDSTVEYYASGASPTNFAWDGDNGTNTSGKQYANLILNQNTDSSDQLTISEKLAINKAAALSGQISVSDKTIILAGTGNTVSLNNSSNSFTGIIEVGTVAISAGAVTLNASSPIKIQDNLYTDSLYFISNVELTGNTIITSTAGNNIHFGNIVNGYYSLETKVGSVQFDGNITGLTSLTCTESAKFNANVSVGTISAQTAEFNCSTVESTSGSQTYNNQVSVLQNTSFTAPENNLINFASNVSGNSSSSNTLTINNANSRFDGEVINFAALTTAANTIFNNKVIVGRLETQTAQINYPQIESIIEGQIYNGPVTISTNLKLKAPAGKLINLKDTTSGNGACSLEIDTANSQFDGQITNLTALTTAASTVFYANINIGSLSTQNANINCASIITSGSQAYNAVVSITADTTLTAPADQSIHFYDLLNGNSSLTISTAPVTFDNLVSGISSLTCEKANINTSAISSTNSQIYNDTIKLFYNGDISLTSQNIQFNNDINCTDTGTQNLIVDAITDINCSNITTTGFQNFKKEADIENCIFASDSTIAFDKTVNARTLKIEKSTTTDFNDLVTITNFIDTAISGNLNFKKGGNITSALTFNTTGNVKFGSSSSDTMTFGTISDSPEYVNITHSAGDTYITGNLNANLVTLQKTYGGEMTINATAKLLDDFEAYGPATFTKKVLLSAATDSIFGKPGYTITISDNLIILHSGALAIKATTTIAENLVIYNGSLTAYAYITTGKDIIILGADYSETDSSTGIETEYAYTTPRHSQWSQPNYTETILPDGNPIPVADYTGRLFVTADKTISCGKNFYANGTTLSVQDTGTDGQWKLRLPNISNPASGFAEAYHSVVTGCKVICLEGEEESDFDGTKARLTTLECTDNGTDSNPNTNIEFDDFEIVNAYTVRDNIIRVEFNRPIRYHSSTINSLKFNNSEEAPVNAFTGFYSNPDCIEGTELLSDISLSYENENDGNTYYYFYIKAAPQNDAEIGAWNTDANGKTNGTSEQSSDRDGIHHDTFPCLDFPRSLVNSDGSIISFILTDIWGHRLKNYSLRPGSQATEPAYGSTDSSHTVDDKTGPVLWTVRTGQELHDAYDITKGADSQHSYDAHNFLEFRYSEPVDFGSPDESVCDIDIPAEKTSEAGKLNEAENTQVSDRFGAVIENISSGSSSTLSFAGLAKIHDVVLYTASQGNPNKYVNALYRTDKYSVRLSIAGWTDGTVSDYNGASYKNWPGYIEAISQFTGHLVTAINEANPLVRDLLGNQQIEYAENQKEPSVLSDSSDLLYTPNPDTYSPWDISSPSFAPLRFNSEILWQECINAERSEAIGNTNGSGSTLDRIEFHLFDNKPSYNSSDIAQWFTEIGWCNPGSQASRENLIDPSYTYCSDIIGGARPFDPVSQRRTSGGIRFSSKLSAAPGFKYSTDSTTPSPQTPFREGSAGVQISTTSPLFTGSASPRHPVNDPDSLYLCLSITDTNLPVETTFSFTYNESNAFVTDLAGNRLRSIYSKTIDRTPPSFDIVLSPVGSNEMYIIFVKPIVTDSSELRLTGNDGNAINISEDFLSLFPDCFQIISINDDGTYTPSSDINIDISIPAKIIESHTNNNFTAIKVFLTKNVTLENVKHLYLQLKQNSNYPETSRDPFTSNIDSHVSLIQDSLGNYMGMYSAHALSDFAINSVIPLYAYSSDMEFEDEKVMDGMYGQGSWAVHDWDAEQKNYGTLPTNHPVDIVADSPEAENVRIYLTSKADSSSISSQFNHDFSTNLRIWLPDLKDGLITALTSSNNTNYVISDGLPLNNQNDSSNLTFSLSSETISNWNGGDQISFMFGIMESSSSPYRIHSSPYYDVGSGLYNLNLNIPVPLFCLRMKDPSDISTLDLWSFKLKDITNQRGGITILNNVINASVGEKTVLKVQFPEAGKVNIAVLTLDGNIITYLNRGNLTAGEHYFTWDGKNKSGTPVARGMYFIRVSGNGVDETRKVMVVKD